MKIPEEYLELFVDNKIYLSRWKNKSILVLNTSKFEDFNNAIANLEKKDNKGIHRFFESGIAKIPIINNEFEIPDYLLKHTENEDLTWKTIKDNWLLIKR